MLVTDQFEVPESVSSCFADKALLAAVEAILSGDNFPAGIAWDEVEDFLKARASAEVVRWEYGVALLRFHEAVWGAPDGWKRCTVDEAAAMTGLKAGDLWDDEEIAVSYERDGSTLYLLAGFNAAETWLGVSVVKDDEVETLAARLDGFDWNRDDEYDYHRWRGNPVQDDQMLAKVKAAAAAALAGVESAFR